MLAPARNAQQQPDEDAPKQPMKTRSNEKKRTHPRAREWETKP